MEWLSSNYGSLIQILVSVVGIFALIATMTPNESDNKIADFLFKLVNNLGANFGKATNATKEELENR
jgi:hypothetical protein